MLTAESLADHNVPGLYDGTRAALPPPRQPPDLPSGPSVQLPPVLSNLTIALDSDSGDGFASRTNGLVRYLGTFGFRLSAGESALPNVDCAIRTVHGMKYTIPICS